MIECVVLEVHVLAIFGFLFTVECWKQTDALFFGGTVGEVKLSGSCVSLPKISCKSDLARKQVSLQLWWVRVFNSRLLQICHPILPGG